MSYETMTLARLHDLLDETEDRLSDDSGINGAARAELENAVYCICEMINRKSAPAAA